MTRFTAHSEVFSFKPEACFAVIEFFNSLDCLKGRLIMALTAILAKLILMGILVTVSAACKLNIAKLLEFFSIHHVHLVAFNTINTCMFSGQGKPCAGMIKFCRRFK
jgi:hypothetical protein